MLSGLWLCHAELHSERGVKELSRNSSRLRRSWDTRKGTGLADNSPPNVGDPVLRL